jgi:hypothetical protein
MESPMGLKDVVREGANTQARRNRTWAAAEIQ